MLWTSIARNYGCDEICLVCGWHDDEIQNDTPPVIGISILNQTGDSIEGLTLDIVSEFEFFKEYEIGLPTIPSGKPVEFKGNLKIAKSSYKKP